MQRGQLTYDKLMQAVTVARAWGLLDVADGLIVIYGCCCRGQDIEHMTAEHIGSLEDDGSAHVWVMRKASAAIRLQKGEYTANTLHLPEAIEVLRHRMELAEKEEVTDLFPNWKAQDASRVVKFAAQLHSWPDNVVWNGAHNARHGAARDSFDGKLTRVMATGMWDTKESAERYGAPRAAIQRLERFQAKRSASGLRGPDPSQAAVARRENARLAEPAAPEVPPTVAPERPVRGAPAASRGGRGAVRAPAAAVPGDSGPPAARRRGRLDDTVGGPAPAQPAPPDPVSRLAPRAYQSRFSSSFASGMT